MTFGEGEGKTHRGEGLKSLCCEGALREFLLPAMALSGHCQREKGWLRSVTAKRGWQRISHISL